MPDRDDGSEYGGTVLCRPAPARGTKPHCDFAGALLHELTVDRPPIIHSRFEALPEDEEAIILRALAGEMPAACLKRKTGIVARCLQIVTIVTASVCSTWLNIDVLAITRRLWGRIGGQS